MNERSGTLQKAVVTPRFDGLAHPRRRQILAALLDRSTPVTVPELAERSQERSREEVHSTLRHVDLPKLADAGLVEYDADENQVSVPDRPARR